MKPYSKNQKPFVYAAFSGHDRERALPILEMINEQGIAFWFSEKFSKKDAVRMEAAYSCIVFVSNDSIHDEEVRLCIEAAERYNKKVLCVYLEPVKLPPGMALHLNALQSIDMGSFNDEQAFTEKLKSAEIFADMKITPAQKRGARRRALVSIIAPIAAAVVIFFALVYPLAILPAMQAENGCLSKLGYGNLSLEELAKIEALHVIGTRTFDQWVKPHWEDTLDEATVDDPSLVVPRGDIRDISDLALLKNAKEITFEGNQVTDISPLYKIKSLELLVLNCNPITSIEGIESLQSLRFISLIYTDVSDITPLFKIPSLEGISFENAPVASIEGIENLKHLASLHIGNSNVTDISPLNKIDFAYLNGTKRFSFEANGSLVKDYSPLQRIPIFDIVQIGAKGIAADSILPFLNGKPISYLYFGQSDIRSVSQLSAIEGIRNLQLSHSQELTSIDGIETHADLTKVNLKGCTSLADLTPLLKLPKLERVIISKDMKDLASSQLTGAGFKIDYED
jgi:hypothetical protein